MRDLKVVGLDVDGAHLICEDDTAPTGPVKYRLAVDDRLRSAVRGDATRVSPPKAELDMRITLRPKDIQAKIRAGASVEQLARATGVDVSRIQRFAHPVLLERIRAAELATAAHPVLADGPSVLTLLESVTTALVSRGLDTESTEWDAWRTEDGRWTVQLAWQAGHSDNVAHFRYAPGAHGGTVTPLDDAAAELVEPKIARPVLRPVAAIAQLERPAAQELAAPELPTAQPEPEAEPELDLQPQLELEDTPRPPARSRKSRPAVPAWEDVLLGVRSSGTR